MSTTFISSNFLSALAKPVKLGISEIQRDIYADRDKVDHVEKKAQKEYESACVLYRELYYLSRYAAGVADQQKHLEKQAFAFRRS